MPAFDTPIHVNDLNWSKILQQKQPVLLYLFDQPYPELDKRLQQLAEQNAGELLITRLNTKENPETYKSYKQPVLPALITLKSGNQQSMAAPVTVADIEAHAAFILGKGPKPAERTRSSTDLIVNVTDQTFHQTVLQSDLPVLVDFWALWCGPCHMLAPIIQKVAEKYKGKLRVAKLNVDENPQTAATYQTMSIPTLILFKHNQVVGRLVGVQPQLAIERLIEQVL